MMILSQVENGPQNLRDGIFERQEFFWKKGLWGMGDGSRVGGQAGERATGTLFVFNHNFPSHSQILC